MGKIHVWPLKKPSILELIIKARVSTALMGLEILLDRVGSVTFDKHRSDAWCFAELAGYLYPDRLIPIMLDGEYELGEAWYDGQRRYKQENLVDPDYVWLCEEEGFSAGWYKFK